LISSNKILEGYRRYILQRWDEEGKNRKVLIAAAAGLLRLAIYTAKKIFHGRQFFESGECF
jgi:hypothetical protein